MPEFVNERISEAEQFLVLALRSGRSEAETSALLGLYRKLGDDAAWAAAEKNKVTPVVGHALLELLSPAEVAGRWERAHDTATAKARAYLTELDRVAARLDAAAVKVAAIESGGIAAAEWCCPGCFVSSDIELLVNWDELEKVHGLLLEQGYTKTLREGRASDDPTRPDSAERGWSVYRKEMLGTAFWLNVMWVPVLRRWCPPPGELETSDLLSRAMRIAARPTALHILSPEDFLLSCACHTASHSYVRDVGLRLQLDIDRIVRRTNIDWAIVVARCRAREICGLVFPALAIPKALLNTPIPDGVFAQLVPSPARRRALLTFLGRASTFNREGAKFGRLRFFLFETHLCDRGRSVAAWRVLFPPADWMRRGYGFRRRWQLPFYYLVRLLDLARRRAV